MPDFATRLADGWRRVLDALPLALVPLLFALTDVNKLQSVIAVDGFHVGFRLGTPISVVTLWQFVSLPQSGVNVDPGVPLETLPVVVVTVPVLLVVQAALSAGYFGSVADHLETGEYRFVANAAAYFLPFLVLTVAPVVLLLPLALGLVGLGAAPRSGGLLVLAVVAFVLLAYLFYATPYLVVLRDTGVLSAARGSYALAVSGGPYLAYAAGVALFVLAVSPVATVVVVNIPVLGLPLGLLVGSVLGLALNTATMRFVADVDPASPVLESWDDGADGDSGGGADEDNGSGDDEDEGVEDSDDGDDGGDGGDSDDGDDGADSEGSDIGTVQNAP
jgi:hypothetical protein